METKEQKPEWHQSPADEEPWWEQKEEHVQDGKIIRGGRALKQRAIKMQQKNDAIHTQKARALDDLCETPKPGEQWRIITEKQFNAYALILSVLERGQIDELYIAIYRINQPTVASIIQLIEDGRIKRAHFVISSFFTNTKVPEVWAKRLEGFCKKHPRADACFVHNHAKVVLIKTGKNHFVFEGSGNMSDNARVEQYLYENNAKTYRFHRDWMRELIFPKTA